MARPQRAGIDYFPFDVGLLKDKKLRRPKMKYGYLATMVYTSLLTLLYSDKGYYIPYGKPGEKDDCIWYVFDSLQGKYQPKADTIAEVIEELVECELFSRDRYPKYITSKRAQAVYYSATVERKSVVIDDAIWLLSLDEMKRLSEKHIYYLSKQTQPINEVNRSNNSVNRPINPESKVENSINHTSVCDIVHSFCSKWGIANDLMDTHDVEHFDFEKLDIAYSESAKFLQMNPVAKCLSWILKNYVSIISRKYKDFATVNLSTDSRIVADLSVDELNKAFADINDDL